MKEWRKYNGALISNLPPDKDVNLVDIVSKIKSSKSLFARWVSNFDCKENMPFWYIIKDDSSNISSYSKNTRNQIRKGLNNFDVRRINKSIILEKGYDIYVSALSHYNGRQRVLSNKEFIDSLDNSFEYWGVFNNKGMLIGYAQNRVFNNSCDYSIIRIHPKSLKKYPFYVLFYKMNEYYLDTLKLDYVTDGARSIYHETNIQEFLIQKFRFRKAYCNIHIVYHPLVKPFILLLLPFRFFFNKIPFTFFKKINVVLFQENIKRDSEAIVNQKKLEGSKLILSNGNFKSGSTWITAIINELINQESHELPLDYRSPKHKNWIHRYKIKDFIFSDEFLSSTSWVSKTHIYNWKIIKVILKYQRNIKVVNIERDLKDVLVSHYFHLLNSGKIKWDFKAYFNNLGKYKAIQYIQYHKVWSQFDFCLNLKYEDLRHSTAEVIVQVAEYLDVKSFNIESIILETDIENLRSNHKSKNLNEEKWFFRKGIVGDWKSYFDASMIAKVNDIKNGKITILERVIFFIVFSVRLKIKYFLYRFFPSLYLIFDKRF
ncbi:MAG: hypothetical protein CMD08_03810 [Flavobacteriales bacterium]|nr:hypothetical protein [Flavobacteriales bacterium]